MMSKLKQYVTVCFFLNLYLFIYLFIYLFFFFQIPRKNSRGGRGTKLVQKGMGVRWWGDLVDFFLQMEKWVEKGTKTVKIAMQLLNQDSKDFLMS